MVRTDGTWGKHQVGCSKRPSSKAAASEEARRTLRYVELLSEVRTPLAEFSSILLGREFSEPKGVEVLVETFTVYQFGMGTGFHEAPFVEDENAIRSLDGR